MLLRLKNIGKIYDSNDILTIGIRGINLDFDYNEFVTIEGESGSGKSTLLNVIGANDSYEEGELYINGEEKATDAPPYIKNEFMIPLRPLAETIGMDILWESDNKCVSLFYPYISAYFDMKAGDIYINAKQRTDLNKAEIVNDRTFMPLSAVQAIFGNSINIENNGDSVSLEFNNNQEEG